MEAVRKKGIILGKIPLQSRVTFGLMCEDKLRIRIKKTVSTFVTFLLKEKSSCASVDLGFFTDL